MNVLDELEHYLVHELLDLGSIKTGNDYNLGRYRMIIDTLVQVDLIRREEQYEEEYKDDLMNQ